MFDGLKGKFDASTKVVDEAFKKAVSATGAAVDSETAKALKSRTQDAYNSAKSIGKYLGDVNGDGRIDSDDLKAAAERAGIAWDKIDPDLKSALVAGGVAGVGINFVPFFGQMLAIPAFAATTAYFYLVAKLTNMRKK